MPFFSHVQREWINFQAQLDLIMIQMKQLAVAKSSPYINYYYISIHSPNRLPDWNTLVSFKFIKTDQLTFIKYSEQRIQRLGEGFDTDCYLYNSTTNSSHYRIRSDCVNICYQDKLRKLCKVDRGIFMSHSLIRKDYLVNGNDKLILCNKLQYNYQSFTIKRDCEEMCKLECNFRYYPIEIDRIDHPSQNNLIKIMHSDSPDIFCQAHTRNVLDRFYMQLWGAVGHVVGSLPLRHI